MAGKDATSARVYEPPLTDQGSQPEENAAGAFAEKTLPEAILLTNIVWFCRLRWIVVAILILYGCTGLVFEWPREIGLQPPGVWPLSLALTLIAGNLFFLLHAAAIKKQSRPAHEGVASLWMQIIFDLLVLTGVVYFLGGVETYFPFAYLFHVGLACIFFPRSWSFAVTVIACLFFTTSVVLETTGILPHSTIYLESFHRPEQSGIVVAVNLISAQIIWLIVWYLMSRLSALVRARDTELARANQRLLEAQKERTRHMLQTTHQLKAPFAAIHANTQLLLKGHCGPLPDQARDIVLRIAARTRRLAREIQDMLQLANLRASSQKPYRVSKLLLADLLEKSIGQLQSLAQEKNVRIDFDRPANEIWITGIEDHLQMMFDNLAANAVTYSKQDGTVQVSCTSTEEKYVQVVIEDNGIGISAEKMPKIFDEYYRTNEAVNHCKESTGLGLSIVKWVAAANGIKIKVASETGEGTRFVLNIPREMGDNP